MKTNNAIKTDSKLFENTPYNSDYAANVKLLDLTTSQLQEHLHTSIYLRSSMFILVLSGNSAIEINFRKFNISKGEIVLLSFGHFFKIEEISDDFRCLMLYVSKDYIDEMFSTEMIYKRAKYGVKMHKAPLLRLQPEEGNLLHKRLSFIREIILMKDHLYLKDMILSALLIFFLELGNIIEKEGRNEGLGNQSRDELYFQQFLELLVLHYKFQHNVEFYAEKQHITAHYLTLIVKRLSGQTVADLIFQLLFSEAKLLLQQPGLSVQQIAEELHFSDQSAFGKFFKRKSGVSPRQFRGKSQ